MKIEAFVISLQRATERHSNVKKILKECPVPGHVVTAVDGYGLSAKDFSNAVSVKRLRPFYPFALRPGEVGVFMSHRKVWQQIIERNLDAGLALEDDISLNPSVFKSSWLLAMQSLPSFDIVKFPVPRRSGGANLQCKPQHVYSPRLVPLGATSLLVTRNAAERLLELSKTFDRPVDAFIQMTWLTGLKACVIAPSGVSEVSSTLGGSTIQGARRTVVQNIARSILRLNYRARVRASSFRLS